MAASLVKQRGHPLPASEDVSYKKKFHLRVGHYHHLLAALSGVFDGLVIGHAWDRDNVSQPAGSVSTATGTTAIEVAKQLHTS